MMTIGFLSYPGFDFCNFFPSFRFLFGVFVLHVVVSFSPLVYNFNKILLTNSGEWSAESAMTRQRKSRADCTDCGHFYTSYTSAFPPQRNRYYYYNNNEMESGESWFFEL